MVSEVYFKPAHKPTGGLPAQSFKPFAESLLTFSHLMHARALSCSVRVETAHPVHKAKDKALICDLRHLLEIMEDTE